MSERMGPEIWSERIMQRTNPSQAQPQARRVLVVEQVPKVRELIERDLADMGLRVVTVDSTPGAMREMRDTFFDVVLTSVGVPGAESNGLARWIRKHHAATEVILLSDMPRVEGEPSPVGASDLPPRIRTEATQVRAAIQEAIDASATHSLVSKPSKAAHVQCECLTSVLDKLPLGVILSDENMVVAHTNRIAGEILSQRDGLVLERDRRLYASRREQTVELRELVTGTGGSRTSTQAGGAIALVRPSGRPSLSVLVSPLFEQTAAERRCPCAAIFVSDPERRAASTYELLRRLYGLTRAEASLASVLMQGRSVEHACESLQISTNTARTHLKRIFAKTGTSRQGELISLLLSSPAVVDTEPS